MIDIKTRCPWIQQNDWNENLRYKCGAAAAQMILYGRDASKFQASNPNKLKDTVAQLKIDQDRIWQHVISESVAFPLPPALNYDGTPEHDQICEGTSFCWATYPDVLASTIAHGVTVTGGAVAGVAAKVRKSTSEDVLEQYIVDSIDRDVAAALLIDHGLHWVTVYRYRQFKNGDVEIHYRDGLHPTVSSKPPWNQTGFGLAMSFAPGATYRQRYVAVTASDRVLQRIRTAGEPPAVVRPRRIAAHPSGRTVMPFRDAIAGRLASEHAADPVWTTAFRNARARWAVHVSANHTAGGDYYLVDYESPIDAGDGRGVLIRRTGSVILDAYDLSTVMTAGIEEPEQELPYILGPDEARKHLDRFDGHTVSIGGKPVTLARSRLRLEEPLFWIPCDQSNSPFVPFYRVRFSSHGGGDVTVFLRADGALFGELTTRLAGV